MAAKGLRTLVFGFREIKDDNYDYDILTAFTVE